MGSTEKSTSPSTTTPSPAADVSEELFTLVPESWLWLPPAARTVLAWVTITLFCASFFVVPLSGFLFLPVVWRIAPVTASVYVALVAVSIAMPLREWPMARKVGQLWYEVFQMRVNATPEKLEGVIARGIKEQFIIAMHPHGVLPMHAVLWAAYCDQYLVSDKLLVDGKPAAMYGFGAAADVVGYLPVLRNIMGWLTAGSASYKVLRDGLVDGNVPSANAIGRRPRHLYILPGGIAEVFTSAPGKHVIVLKKRRGLVRLSIETGAAIIPTYVFGATDFFNNLATADGFFSGLSRKLRTGITIFWGPFGLPIPFAPRVTMCIGDPIPVPSWDSRGKGKGEGKEGAQRVPEELIEELHKTHTQAMIDLFNKYKAAAGYPDAELEIV